MTGALRRRADALLAPGTRGRALAGALVDRVVAPLAGGAPPWLKGGPGGGDARVVLVLVRAATPERVGAVVERLAEAQRVLGGFTPVVLVDGRAMVPVRRGGFVVEHLPASGPAFADALVECRRTYATDVVVVVGEGSEPPDVALLDGVLRPRPRDVWLPGALRRALRRAEREFERVSTG